MFVACSHRGGINCNGVIVNGPPPPLPPGVAPDLSRPKTYGAYAITEVHDTHSFLIWAEQNATSLVIRQGVLVWAESEPALQLAIFEGRRAGQFHSPTPWAETANHVASSE